MEEGNDRPHVAVYIDFDNIIMSRYDELHGRQAFRDDNAGKRNPESFIRQKLTEARVSILAIMDFASSFGTVAVGRAYADWSTTVNASYGRDLLRSSIDLVQMFPVTSSKNGADIRLAIDVIDDMARFPHLTHVLIVAGDSDYISLAQRCRRLGRKVIGVGAANSVGQYFEASCDEFRYYGNLPGVRDSKTEPETMTYSRGKGNASFTELVIRAARLLSAKAADEWLAVGDLKSQMLRLDPTFDENGIGFASFTEFLRGHATIVEIRWPEGVPGGQVRLKNGPGVHSTSGPDTANADAGLGVTTPHDGAAEAGEILKGLGLLAGPGGPDWEDECIAAVRSAWQIIRANPDASITQPPTTDVLAALGGDRPTVEQRRAVHVVFSLLPWLGRDEDNVLRPNEDFTALSQESLLKLLRESVASRIRHKLYPKSVTAKDIALAMFPLKEPPEDAISAFERVVALPTVQQMSETLRPALLAAPVLWDVASAAVAIPRGVRIATVDALADALERPLRELDRDPVTVPMYKAYTALTVSGVLTSVTDEDGAYNAFVGAETQDVAAQVIQLWASRLRDAGQSYPNEQMWFEAFYRLVLPDRHRIAWRAWVRSLTF